MDYKVKAVLSLFAQEDIQWLEMTESMEEEPTRWS